VAKFTPVTSQQIKGTLARKFVGLGDTLRNMLTTFGLRTYRVSLVGIQWSGGERGVGTPTVLSELLILPTPKLVDMTALTEIVQPIGLDEAGSVQVEQISGTFTEEQLLGRDANGNDIPADQEFFWEIEFPRLDGKPGEKRRFFPRGAPMYYPGRLQWVVRLEKGHSNRQRDGSPGSP